MLSHFRLFETLWTVARQAPLSMGFFQARIMASHVYRLGLSVLGIPSV